MTATRTDLLSVTRTLLCFGFGLVAVVTVALTIMLAVMTFGDPSTLSLGNPAIGLDSSIALTPEQRIFAIRGQLVLGLFGLVLALLVLRLLIAIVDSARDGDPFVPENGARLRRIGWLILVGNVVMWLGTGIVTTAKGLPHLVEHSDSSPFSVLLTILLVFVLARVFETGSRMRTELKETI